MPIAGFLSQQNLKFKICLSMPKHSSKNPKVTPRTQFLDESGRMWRIVENLYFGRWLARCESKPGLIGEWTSKEIKESIQQFGSLPDGEDLGYHTP